MRQKTLMMIMAGLVMVLPGVLLFPGSSLAVQTNLGKDTVLDVATTLRWGGAWRVKDRDSKLVSDINSDDGDRNFDKGDMINNQFSAIMDIELRYKDTYGFFLRPKAFYDFAYRDGNSNNSPITNNNGPVWGGPLHDNDDFMDQTKDQLRDKVEILDAYAYGEFNPLGHAFNLRVGRQVVSWGESIFLLNSISSAQSPVDATAAHNPGTELRDIFLPVGQVYGQLDLSENLTLEAYYQWEWDENRIDEAGSYFSTDDYLFRAGKRYLVPVDLSYGLAASIDSTGRDLAKNSGQWGAALRYLVPSLDDTEFGLYYINYHDKMPELIGSFSGGTPYLDWTTLVPGPDGELLNLVDSSSYKIKYAQNIHLVGASFGTVLFDTNVSGEVSYRSNQPVMVADPNNILEFSYNRAHVLQGQVSFIHIMSQRLALIWDDATLLGEVGFNRVDGEDGDLIDDSFAWGGTVELDMTWFNLLLPKLDLTVPVVYQFNPHGTSPVLGTFSEHNDSLGVSLNFTYRSVYQVGFGYTTYIGKPEDNKLTDRDFVSMNFKYTF